MKPRSPSKRAPPIAPPRIVSSAHLAVGRGAEVSEFEYGMIMCGHAFNRWIVRCMAAAGVEDLTSIDVLVLHHVHHRARNKRLADICFVLNVEDTHVVSYSLKKLVAAGLVKSEKNGKEVLFSTSARGQALIERYRGVRDACLVASLTADGSDNDKLADVAGFLRFMSGMYDQASRAASSL
jgi:predicted MarR family transcription regulator